jgi:hypothetical protein
MRNYLAALLLLAPVAVATPALAEGSSECTDAPQSEWMSTADVTARLTGDGYEVRDVAVQGSCYEVKAIKDGERIEARVNPVTGAVTVGNDDDGDE